MSESDLSRRAVIAAAGAVSASMFSHNVSADHGRNNDENVNVYIHDHGMFVRWSADRSPDSVVAHTDQGESFEFTGVGQEGDIGYSDDYDQSIGTWAGKFEEVELQFGSEAYTYSYESDAAWEFNCSTWTVEIQDDTDVSFEDAHKKYDAAENGSDAPLGSPGRAITHVEEVGLYDMDMPDCTPDGDRAVTFDCTSVTVESEEFVNGSPDMYNPVLHFVDGTQQRLDGEFQAPQTFEGAGEHEGKVIQRLTIDDDSMAGSIFGFNNPDAGSCSPDSGNESTATPQEDGEETPTPTPEEDNDTQVEETTPTPTDTSTRQSVRTDSGTSQSGSSTETTDTPETTPTPTETTTSTPTPTETNTTTYESYEMIDGSEASGAGPGLISGMMGLGIVAYLRRKLS